MTSIMKSIGSWLCACLLISCASVPANNPGAVTISLVRDLGSCQGAHGFTCVELEVANRGGAVIQFGLSTINELVVLHSGSLEKRLSNGTWEDQVTEIGTYEAPVQFLVVRPATTARLIMPMPNIRVGSAASDAYRVVISDAAGARYQVPIP